MQMLQNIPGMLIDAINASNATPGILDEIIFSIDISLTNFTSQIIIDQVVLDGSGFDIELNSSNITFGFGIFTFFTGSDGSTIKNIRITGSSGYGIFADGLDDLSIMNNTISGCSQSGIQLENGDNPFVYNNFISNINLSSTKRIHSIDPYTKCSLSNVICQDILDLIN